MAARKPADPTARLAILKTAFAKSKRGDTLNANELSKAIGMTQRHMMNLIAADPGWPIKSRGAEGLAYTFDVQAVLKHLIAKCEVVLKDRRGRAARMARLSGLATPMPAADPQTLEQPESLTAGDLKTIGEAQMLAHKLKMMQGQYVRADEMQATLTGFCSDFQTDVLGLLGKIDPAGQWPATIRMQVEDGLRTVLMTAMESMERRLTAGRVATAG